MTQVSFFRKYTTEQTFEKIVEYQTICQMWKHSVDQYADNIALCDVSSKVTYSELEKKASLVRGLLKKNGLEMGQFVGVLYTNSIDCVVAYLGIVTYGCVAVLLPPQLDEKTLFGCSLKYSLKAIFTGSLKEKLGILKQMNPTCKVLHIEDKAEPVEMSQVNADSPAAVLFTGGTTGKSKGALLSHKAVVTGTRFGCYGYHDVFEEKYFLVLPLTHVFGLIRNLMTSLYTGSTLWICKNNKDMFKEMAIFEPTILVLVPALAEMALNLSKQFGKNLVPQSVKYIICGAATVKPYLVKEYKKIGITLFPGYGLTESANLVSGNPECEKHPESVGFVYPGIETKVVNGELWLKGPNMMTCYVGESEEMSSSYEDGWFKTGDIVRFDEQNLMYIVGRIKEMIVLPTGMNVFPAVIEDEFNKLDCIQDCLVYEKDGCLTLEVLPRQSELTAVQDVESFIKAQVESVNKNLASHEKISNVVIRTTDFLRSPSMKILRNQNK